MRLPKQSQPVARTNHGGFLTGLYPSQSWTGLHGLNPFWPSIDLNFVSNIHRLCPGNCSPGYLMTWDWGNGCRCIPHPLGWGLR